MRIAYVNPNSTAAMTESVVAVARAALPGIEVVGLTNAEGSAAIQGAEDGAAAIPGVLKLVSDAVAEGAAAVVIACFDDTGLAEARTATDRPVLGIGQSAYVMASLLGLRFSVVTSLAVSVPVIEGNIAASGFAGSCASVRASGLPVLTIEEGGEATRARLGDEIRNACDQDGATAVILGCAGMAAMQEDLARRSGVFVIDGVAASAQLALAAIFQTSRAALNPIRRVGQQPEDGLRRHGRTNAVAGRRP